MDGENGAKTIVYNTKRDSKEEGGKKNKKSERLKKYNSKKKEFYTIDHTIRLGCTDAAPRPAHPRPTR